VVGAFVVVSIELIPPALAKQNLNRDEVNHRAEAMPAPKMSFPERIREA
jgi:hypothetical protein